MTYKTILVHVDRSAHAERRIELAAQVAVRHGAHLIGAAMTGISRFVYQDSSVDLSRTVLAGQLDELYREAEESLATFDAIASRAGTLSFERRLVDDDPSAALSLQGRCADLVVLSQEDLNEGAARLYPGLPPYVMLNCGRPVLLVPCAAVLQSCGQRPLIAWDGSIAASRAVANALPMLKMAQKVSVVTINAPDDTAQSSNELAVYLARHDVNVELLSEQTTNDVGEALLSLAADRGTDLLVMGGYGHARFREILLGGATRTILKSMTVPVLISH